MGVKNSLRKIIVEKYITERPQDGTLRDTNIHWQERGKGPINVDSLSSP